MSKRRQQSELVWIPAQAGYGSGDCYAVIMPEHGFLLRRNDPSDTREIVDQIPCLLECDDPACMEWSDLFALPGSTRQEAIANLIARRYTGACYHVSECQMYTNPPDR